MTNGSIRHLSGLAGCRFVPRVFSPPPPDGLNFCVDQIADGLIGHAVAVGEWWVALLAHRPG